MSSIVDERGFNQGFELTTSQRIRLLRRGDAIAEQMDLLPAAPAERAKIRVLEIGCGTGELARHLAEVTGARVTGVDLSPKFINYAKATHSLPNLDFRVLDLSQSSTSSGEERFHYIVGNGILHHLFYRLDGVLASFKGRMVPRGRLIFWEPNLINPYIFLIFKFPLLRRLARLEPDEMAFTPRFIRRRLERAGFSNVRVQTRDFLLPTTPEILIPAVVRVGDVLEQVPPLSLLAQSVFLTADV